MAKELVWSITPSEEVLDIITILITRVQDVMLSQAIPSSYLSRENINLDLLYLHATIPFLYKYYAGNKLKGLGLTDANRQISLASPRIGISKHDRTAIHMPLLEGADIARTLVDELTTRFNIQRTRKFYPTIVIGRLSGGSSTEELNNANMAISQYNSTILEIGNQN